MESVLENTVPMQTEQAGVQATAIPDNNCNINEKKSIPKIKNSRGRACTDR